MSKLKSPRAIANSTLVRKTPLRQSSSVAGPVTARKPRKPIKKVNTKRRASEFKRCYHSRARVAFVKALPCAACGVIGYSENAHVMGNGGAGRKGDYTTIAPLCGLQFPKLGCHRVFDTIPYEFRRRFPNFNREAAAAACEASWLTSQEKAR